MIQQRTIPKPDSRSPQPRAGAPRLRLTGPEWRVLLVLAAVQFTHIVDFMIVMPLGPRYMDEMGLDAAQFGRIVAAYGFSAGIASLLASWFIDHFDRKNALLVLYAGLTGGTLLCAFAPSYLVLVLARAVAGAFGGVTAACVLTVVGDVFPDARRGTANGVVMSAFSVASIAGVPAGLWLADLLGWRAPFAVLAGLSAVVLLLIFVSLPSLRGHLGHVGPRARSWDVLSHPGHLRAYSLMVALVLSSFLVVPYLATYLVKNAGLLNSELLWVYLVGGAVTLVSTPLVGWLSDRWGKPPVFRIFALLTVIPLVMVTNLGPSSLLVILLVTTLMMILTSGRMVPAMALITASAAPRYRGSFLSINASVQQVAMGLASLAGGAILGSDDSGALTHYSLAGALAAGAALLSVYLAGYLRPAAGGMDALDSLEASPSQSDSEPIQTEDCDETCVQAQSA